MEGAGEGVVAVVRGLPDAGLAVSLQLTPVPRPRRARLEPRASQTVSEYGNINNMATYNEAYASTYQVAHCGARVWPSALCLPEFPPQRLKPCPTQGNFEVGAGISRSLSPTHNNFQSSRVRWDRRRHLPRPQHDRDVDAFISSLRKYPSAERSPSSDLLERLLKTSAHTPHSPKGADLVVFSKSLRNLGEKHGAAMESKGPQASKRSRKRDKSRKPHKTHTVNVQFDITHQKTQIPEKYPLPNGTVSVSAFDYLNSARTRSPPGTPERRAGRSEPRTLRDAFREIYRDERGPMTAFPICPTMQSRYERHLKQYHPSTSQVPHIDVTKLKTCNKCLQKRPCPCETAKILRRTVDKEDEEKRKFEDAIFSWLKDIPVYPNENPHDKFIRDAIVKKLAETLSSIDDDEFTVKGREEIKQAIEKLPMWYPSDERDRENFKSNIIDNLLDKIKSTKAEKRFKKATENFFAEINFDDSKEMNRAQALDGIIMELDKIARNRPEDDDVYRDMLKMKAFELLDRLPIKTNVNRYDYLNQLSDELADHLLSISRKPMDAAQKQTLINGISDILDETNDRIWNIEKVEESLRDVVSDVVAQIMDSEKAKTHIKTILEGKVDDSEIEDMTNKLLALADASHGEKRFDPETTQIIKEDIRDILDLSDSQIKNRSKVEQNLHKAVSDIVSKGMDDDKALTHLKTILKGKVAEDKVEDIAKQVLALAGQVTPIQAKTIDHETKQFIKQDISDILDLSDSPIKNRSKVEENLRSLVSDIVTKGMNEEKAKAHIKTILKGKVTEDKVEDITNQVLAMAGQVTPIQAKAIDQETKQIIKEDISDILDLSETPIKNRGKVEENLRNLVADIVRKGMSEDKAMSHIKTILKGKVTEDKVEDIARQVLTLANQVTPIQAKTIDQETKQIIKEDISDILDLSDSPIKNRGKVEENLRKLVADIATKGMDKNKAISHIKTILKGKVSEDKFDDIAEQVLALANQVTPSKAETINQESKQIIKDDLRDILDLSDTRISNRGKVEGKLRNLVADIVLKGMDKDKAVTQIKSILKGKVSEDKMEDITQQVLALADQITTSEGKIIDQESIQLIKTDISDILELSDSHIKNRSKLEENLHKAVADIVTKGMDKDKAISHIKTILKGKVSVDKVEDIAKQVLALADQITPNQAQTIDRETKQIIKEDINDILDFSDSPIKNRGKVEENLRKLVADIATKRMDKDKAQTHIKAILKGKVSEDKIEDIARKVLALANRVTPMQVKEQITERTKQIIKGDINDILDLSKSHIKNRDVVEGKLHQLVTDMVTKKIDKDKAKTHIESILKGKVPEDKLDEISKKVLALANQVEERTSTTDPQLQETITDDISNILDQTRGHIKNRVKVEESLRDIINDLVMRGMDTGKAHEHIHSILKGNVSDSEAAEISRKILALADEMSFRTFSSGPSASSTRNADKIYFDQVYEVIRDWLSNHVIGLHEKKLNEVAEAIANDTIDRQKYLQMNSLVKSSQAKELEILKEHIYKGLNRLIDKKSVQSVMPEVEALMRSLKEIPVPQLSQHSGSGLVQDSTTFVQENLEGALLDWLRGSPIYQDRNQKNKQTQEQMMTKLAASLAAVLSSQAKEKRGPNTDATLIKEITKHLEDLPLEPQFKSKEYIRKLGDHMLDFLKSLQLFQDISARISMRDTQRTTSFMPSTNHLNDIVRDWCETLPLPNTDETYRIKQDLANKIILKIGELNMNQDIFNDDLLYEEILQDFVDQQIKALQIDLNVTEASKNLLDQIKEVKQRVQDSLVGRAYRQQLRATISNTLPSMACPTVEDLASFELLKENLADAFINLNYTVEDEAARAKFRRKITDEINKFVNDYLGCCPATPVNTRKLNRDLYNALNNVPVPGDESMRSEVEAVRMKDLINDWLKTLPLGKQTKAEQLHTSKIVTLMAQKLQELENEFNPEFSEIAKEEIEKYLKKLPLRNKNNLDVMAKKLVDKITNTTESRSFIAGTSSARESDSCFYREPPLPYPCSTDISGRPSYLSCDSIIPPCGLSKEDKKMLQRIRERAQPCQVDMPSAKRCCKDAAINPPPSDHGSQTVMTPNQSKSCQCANKFEPVCAKTKPTVTPRPCTSTGSQADLSPYVLVKEYYWDSTSDGHMDFASQTPAQISGRPCVPSALLPSQNAYSPQECMDPCGILRRSQLRPRSCRDSPSRRGITVPRRQVASACPNEYFRPKPHNCSAGRSRPIRSSERDHLRSRYREPSCSRRRSSCLTCHEDPTAFCPKCCTIPCPHPTYLYFK